MVKEKTKQDGGIETFVLQVFRRICFTKKEYFQSLKGLMTCKVKEHARRKQHSDNKSAFIGVKI